MKYMKPKDTWNKEFINLSGWAKSIQSEHGEDGLIEAIFEVCKPRNKWCVDVGASDGYSLSNTWNLVTWKGWKAVMIEKVEETLRDGELYSGYLKIVERFKGNDYVYPVCKEVTRKNLDEILTYLPVPYNFDFLSLDIDSYDVEVWQNLVKHRPNLICIECDESEHDLSKVSYKLDRPNACNPASVGYLKQIAKEKGYDFLCVDVCNAFFVEEEFGKPLRIK